MCDGRTYMIEVISDYLDIDKKDVRNILCFAEMFDNICQTQIRLEGGEVYTIEEMFSRRVN